MIGLFEGLVINLCFVAIGWFANDAYRDYKEGYKKYEDIENQDPFGDMFTDFKEGK